MKRFGVSERFACRVLGQHRSTQRKIARTPDDEAALSADIIALLRYGLRPNERGGLGRQRQARGAYLAAGGAESSTEATEAQKALAQCRVVHPLAGGASQSRVVL